MSKSLNATLENPLVETLGQQLKKTREVLNLTIEDVAKKTNLKKSHIESLENDIFILQNVAPTFVKGYVRNYLRFLRLPESLGASVNYGEVTLPKNKSKMPSPKAVQKSQTKWVKYLTVFVLLGAIGMTLLWWWQDYQQQQANRDQFVNNIAIEIAPTPAMETALPAVVPETQPVAEVAPVPAVEEQVPSVEIAPMPAELPTPAPESEPANVLQAVENSQEIADVEQSVVVGNDELRIEITGKESWVTVRGKSNKRLAEKLYSNGEVLTFNDNEQYRLTIGAPANVKLYYKGQVVPLKIDGRVARIKLPLAQ